MERERHEIVKVEGSDNQTYLGARIQVPLTSFRIAERFSDSRNRFSGLGPGDKLGFREQEPDEKQRPFFRVKSLNR